uniref:RGS domain-containing protein n=1 Tax=Bursaphelenchus xylophilus TaxID=6326 RepID=A0A1I7SPG7_BURXY
RFYKYCAFQSSGDRPSMAHSLDKPTKAYCLKALDEAVFDILKNQTYSDATAGFLNDKIVAALTQKFKGTVVFDTSPSMQNSRLFWTMKLHCAQS